MSYALRSAGRSDAPVPRGVSMISVGCRHGAGELAGLEDQHLAARRVPADVAQIYAGQHLGVAVEKLDRLVPVEQGSEVIQDVARLAAHVGMHRKVPLAFLDEVTGPGKR